MNFKRRPVAGAAKGVKLRLCPWDGHVDFSIAPMYGADIILRLDIMRHHNAALVPAMKALCIFEDKNNFI